MRGEHSSKELFEQHVNSYSEHLYIHYDAYETCSFKLLSLIIHTKILTEYGERSFGCFCHCLWWTQIKSQNNKREEGRILLSSPFMGWMWGDKLSTVWQIQEKTAVPHKRVPLGSGHCWPGQAKMFFYGWILKLVTISIHFVRNIYVFIFIYIRMNSTSRPYNKG